MDESLYLLKLFSIENKDSRIFPSHFLYGSIFIDGSGL